MPPAPPPESDHVPRLAPRPPKVLSEAPHTINLRVIIPDVHGKVADDVKKRDWIESILRTRLHNPDIRVNLIKTILVKEPSS